MTSLNDILGKENITNDGIPVHPIKVSEWEKFEDVLGVLMIDKSRFEEMSEAASEYDLFSLIVATRDNQVMEMLKEMLDMTIKETFEYVENGNDYSFSSESYRVDSSNYDEVRRIIMDQNIIFPPKVFKDPVVRKFAEKKIKQMQKDSPDITLEDMISTVCSQGGKHPWEIGEYTMYQLKMEFNRVCQWQQWLVSSLSQVHTETKLDITHFGETIDLRKDPYEDLFSKGAKNIKEAFKN